LMSILATQSRNGLDNNLIFNKVMKNEDVSEKELLVSGMIPDLTRKVS